jgi:GTP-binding protein
VVDPKTGAVLEDLDKDQMNFLAARGGRGGRGNAHFATARVQVPRRVERGKSGEERWLHLDLRLPADVGLVGPPNSGKSTLISRISSARPRIADYPFTTTWPNLGVVREDDFTSFVVVDMPGLIKNAHQGAGLGAGFLKHIERAALLVHVLDVTCFPDRTPLEAYDATLAELMAFDPQLGRKNQIAAINKIDLIESPDRLKEFEQAFVRRNIPTCSISAMSGRGVHELTGQMGRHLR